MKLELKDIRARHVAARPESAPALQGLALDVASGEQIAIIGPSGAGKTTLLQVLACALRPDAGALSMDAQNPWSLPTRRLQALRGRLCLAPQMPPLPPRQRVVTAVLAARLPRMSLAASVRSLFYPTDIAAAFGALDRFDLGDKLFERVDRLSGGERQRVGLARAVLAVEPDAPSARAAELLLVDEPLSALDPTRARRAIQAITEAARQRGATLVATLHQVDVALQNFGRIVGLRAGVKVFDCPAAEVTPAILAQLYAEFEHELSGAPAAPPELLAPAVSAPAPAVMHCR